MPDLLRKEHVKERTDEIAKFADMSEALSAQEAGMVSFLLPFLCTNWADV